MEEIIYDLGCDECGAEYSVTIDNEDDTPDLCPFCGASVEIEDEEFEEQFFDEE
jgi:predicted nucleic acid-binding Zn ribbon protein